MPALTLALQRCNMNGRSRYLTALLVSLAIMHVGLVYAHQSAGQLGISMVCWVAVMVSGRRREEALGRPSHGLLANAFGLIFILALLGIAFGQQVAWTPLLAIYPIWAGVGVCLLTKGFCGLRHYWRELLILIFLGIPHGFLLGMVDLSSTTAQFAAFLLHYCGREVVLVGTEIALPGGAVEVVKSCDGTGAMAYLACLAVVFLVLFPTSKWQRIVMVPLAMGIAFLTNGIRVALLAVIESSAGAHAFDYWHTGTGAMLWTGLPVLLFGLICFGLLHFQSPPELGPAPEGMGEP